MLQNFITIISNIIIPLGAFGVFLAEFLDGLFVFVPTTLIFLIAGFVFLKGPMSWVLIKTMLMVVVLPASVGLVLGSFIFYIPSYIYGKRFVELYGKWIGVSWADIKAFDARLEKTHWDEIGIILARIALVPSVMVTVFCGVTRIPPKKYTIITFIGGFFKALSVALVGWSAGELYLQYADAIDKVEKIVFVIIVLCCIGFIAYRRWKKNVVL